jgi:hypothetical protein
VGCGDGGLVQPANRPGSGSVHRVRPGPGRTDAFADLQGPDGSFDVKGHDLVPPRAHCAADCETPDPAACLDADGDRAQLGLLAADQAQAATAEGGDAAGDVQYRQVLADVSFPMAIS